MYKIKVNNQFNFETELKNDAVVLDGSSLNIDWINIEEGKFHILKDNKSFLAEVVEYDNIGKTFKIKVNNHQYSLEVKDKFDELLKSLGLDSLNSQKIKEIKAPMPGLVLKILVSEGDSINKGDNLLILEAMKMENILKSPSDVIVKKINIKIGDKVEKNQVMLTLD